MQASTLKDELPEIEPALKNLIYKPLTGGRWWRRLKNGILAGRGRMQVLLYFRTLAYHDDRLKVFSEQIQSDFFWEGGIGSMSCDFEKIFLQLRRMRRQGLETIQQCLYAEYCKFRDSWLERHGLQVSNPEVALGEMLQA